MTLIALIALVLAVIDTAVLVSVVLVVKAVLRRPAVAGALQALGGSFPAPDPSLDDLGWLKTLEEDL